MNLPNKKYNIIYADPAWHFKHWNDETVTRKAPYDVMSKEDIKNLPVKDLADDNCILFIWVTFPKLDKCMKTFEHWGFEYKTIAFNWVKTNKKNGKPFFGVGYYTKSNTEVCLLGVKGKMKPISNHVSSVVIEPRLVLVTA